MGWNEMVQSCRKEEISTGGWGRTRKEKRGQPCQGLELRAEEALGSLSQTGRKGSKGLEGKAGGRVKRRVNQKALPCIQVFPIGDCGISQTWQAKAEGRVRTPSSGRGRKGEGAMPRTAPPGGVGQTYRLASPPQSEEKKGGWKGGRSVRRMQIPSRKNS